MLGIRDVGAGVADSEIFGRIIEETSAGGRFHETASGRLFHETAAGKRLHETATD
jgi:hypothetical protein